MDPGGLLFIPIDPNLFWQMQVDSNDSSGS